MRHSQVNLVVTEFGNDASVVTKVMGIEPSSSCSCGWSSGPQISAWVLESQAADTIEERLDNLFAVLEERAAEVRLTAAQFRARIEISVDDRDWIFPYDPDGYRAGSFELPVSALKRAAELNLGVRVGFMRGIK